MGKDREGKFHPSKGKPSVGKEGTIELHTKEDGAMDQYLETAEKYTEGPEELPANVRIRHPNRNTDKNAPSGDAGKPNKRYGKRSTGSAAKDSSPDEEKATTPAEARPLLQGLATRELLQRLFEHQGSVCISAYLPTHQAGGEANEGHDLVIFKNFLQSTTSQLRDRGLDGARIDALLAPGYELLRQENFWKRQDQGLAVFISEGIFELVRMPQPPREQVMVNARFFVAPLVPFIASESYYYLLVVSKKQSKLFKANQYEIQHLDIPEIPNGVDDVVHLEEKDDRKLWRTGSSGAGGGANYHGIGAGKPDEKENIAMYLEEVDDTIWEKVLNNERAPLLLAGVDYLLPIYKSVSEYRNIWDHALTGSYEHEDLPTLHQRANEAMAAHFQEPAAKALAAYGNQSATDLTTTSPQEIIPAAYYGRVSTLFVLPDHHIWGRFDEANNALVIHEQHEAGDECLVNAAVMKTVLQGGQVYFLNKEEMPDGSVMAAQLRYPVASQQ